MSSTFRPHHRATKLAALAAALAVTAAACGGGGKKSDTSSGTGGSSTTAADTGTVKPGGSITFGLESDVSTLDPAKALAQPADKVIALGVYDPLISYDKDNKLIPYLAKDFQLADDLKSLTMDLPTGVKFQDGTDFNADAVVAHFTRLKDPATQCTCASVVAKIAEVKATSPTQVVFTLTEPNVAFPTTLAGTLGYVPSPTAVKNEGGDYARRPVGTGPFKLTEFVSGDHFTMVKNPNYWKKDDKGNQLPYLDQIIFKPVPDTKQREAALEAGNVDMYQSADPSTLKAAQNAGFEVQEVTGSSSTIDILNNTKAPFDDPRIRQAFSYAIDREAFIQVLYDGTRKPAYSPFSTDSNYYIGKAGEQPHFDLAKAKELVKAYGKPVNFLLECIPTPEGQQGSQIIKQMLEAAGMQVTLKSQEQGQYVTRMFQKQYDGAACFRSAQFSDPDALYSGLHSGETGNLANYSSKTVDAALEKGRSTADVSARKDAYATVQKEIAKDVPVVYLDYDLFINVHKKQIKGLPNPEANSLGAIKPTTLWLDR